MAELRRLLSSRRPLYAEADHTVETSGVDTDEVVRRIEAVVAPAGERPRSRASAL
jgi:hypothetical protein